MALLLYKFHCYFAAGCRMQDVCMIMVNVIIIIAIVVMSGI